VYSRSNVPGSSLKKLERVRDRIVRNRRVSEEGWDACSSSDKSIKPNWLLLPQARAVPRRLGWGIVFLTSYFEHMRWFEAVSHNITSNQETKCKPHGLLCSPSILFPYCEVDEWFEQEKLEGLVIWPNNADMKSHAIYHTLGTQGQPAWLLSF
jgi:hypothetical protein